MFVCAGGLSRLAMFAFVVVSLRFFYLFIHLSFFKFGLTPGIARELLLCIVHGYPLHFAFNTVIKTLSKGDFG